MDMGWQSYPFLVTPEELKTAFEPFKLVVSNTCVPIDYTDTPVEDFLKSYSALYERLISGGVIDWKTESALLDQIAITSNLPELKFGMEHELDGKMAKAVMIDKKISPLPYLAPFTFNIYSKNNIKGNNFSCSLLRRPCAAKSGIFLMHGRVHQL